MRAMCHTPQNDPQSLAVLSGLRSVQVCAFSASTTKPEALQNSNETNRKRNKPKTKPVWNGTFSAESPSAKTQDHFRAKLNSFRRAPFPWLSIDAEGS